MVEIAGRRFYEQSDIKGISRATLHRWRRSGRLECLKLGSRVLFTEKHVAALLGDARRSAKAMKS